MPGFDNMSEPYTTKFFKFRDDIGIKFQTTSFLILVINLFAPIFFWFLWIITFLASYVEQIYSYMYFAFNISTGALVQSYGMKYVL